MKELDRPTGDDATYITHALDDLASTMSDAPALLEGVHRRVDRLRHRRRVVRAGAGLAVCGLSVLGLAALRRPAGNDATLGALAASAPDCVGRATAPDPTAEMGTNAEVKGGVVIESAMGAGGVPAGIDDVELTKVMGTVVGEPVGDQVTVHVEGADAAPPRDVTITLTDETHYVDGTTKVDARPALSAGEQVLAGFHVDGSANVADVVMVRPPLGADQPSGEAVTAVKLVGTVVAPTEGDQVTVRPDEPFGTEDITVTVSADTEYFDGGATIARPALADGQRVVVAAHDSGAGYVADVLGISPEPAVPPQEVPKAEGAAGMAARARLTMSVVSVDGSVVTLSPVEPAIDVPTLTADLQSVGAVHADGTACAQVDLAAGQYVTAVAARTNSDPWIVGTLVFP